MMISLCGVNITEDNYKNFKYVLFENDGALCDSVKYVFVENLFYDDIVKGKHESKTQYRWVKHPLYPRYGSWDKTKQNFYDFLKSELKSEYLRAIMLIDHNGVNHAEYELFD